ncbi:PadR family transcriptional regulator [Bacillus sp. CGMCC 1.16607]|uniref:PadR family transcriptional regulator n=1 Tax=Bacillus sp. CGMCC 1.16607 TaxID=3351842 RepID=UPI003630859E
MNLQDVILGFLCEKPMTGYEIKQQMENSVGFFLDASFGGIYPALRKLEKEGFVDKQIIPQEGKPNKNLFVITESGKEVFQDYLNSPLNPTTIKSDILTRLFFAQFTSKENIIDWLKDERDRNEMKLKQYEMIDQQHELEKFQRFTLNYGIRISEMIISLINEELQKLEGEL